jgi:hypothetical protein
VILLANFAMNVFAFIESINDLDALKTFAELRFCEIVPVLNANQNTKRMFLGLAMGTTGYCGTDLRKSSLLLSG